MFRICTLRSFIFYACKPYQFMYGLTVWITYLPKCFHKLSNIVCLYTQLILHVYAHVTVVFEIHASTLHMGHAGIVYIHSWLHCCQTSVARRLKQNKTKRLKQQNHEIYHFFGSTNATRIFRWQDHVAWYSYCIIVAWTYTMSYQDCKTVSVFVYLWVSTLQCLDSAVAAYSFPLSCTMELLCCNGRLSWMT